MITLQEFTSADFDRLKSWVDSEMALIQFAGPIFRYPLTDQQLHDYLAEPQRRAFRVAYEQRIIGHAEVMLSKDGVAKLCRILIGNPADRGQGLGEQIIRALISVCWRKFDAREIELNVYDWNVGAIRCYEKVGFVRRPEKTFVSTVGGQEWRAVNMVLHS